MATFGAYLSPITIAYSHRTKIHLVFLEISSLPSKLLLVTRFGRLSGTAFKIPFFDETADCITTTRGSISISISQYTHHIWLGHSSHGASSRILKPVLARLPCRLNHRHGSSYVFPSYWLSEVTIASSSQHALSRRCNGEVPATRSMGIGQRCPRSRSCRYPVKEKHCVRCGRQNHGCQDGFLKLG